MIAKSRRPEAERAAEWYLRERCGCILTRRAVRTKWQAVDFFACDVMGKMADGRMVWAQATAGANEALRVRRRKLERVPWQATDIVLVLQLTSTEDPANRKRTLWFFRVHRLLYGEYDNPELVTARNNWMVDDQAEPVPPEWFRAWKEKEQEI